MVLTLFIYNTHHVWEQWLYRLLDATKYWMCFLNLFSFLLCSFFSLSVFLFIHSIRWTVSMSFWLIFWASCWCCYTALFFLLLSIYFLVFVGLFAIVFLFENPFSIRCTHILPISKACVRIYTFSNLFSPILSVCSAYVCVHIFNNWYDILIGFWPITIL